MSKSNLQELAKRGDAEAIAILMQRALEGKNIQVQVQSREECLHILFESKRVPDPDVMVNFVSQGMAKMGVESALYLRIFGYETGQPFPQWLEQLYFVPESRSWMRANLPKSDCKSAFSQVLASLPQGTTESQLFITTGERRVDRFIVCGLGGLGQHCVLDLKKFAYRNYQVEVIGIDRVKPELTEVNDLERLLDGKILIGDCRRTDVLEQAGIHSARAILFVTSDESANIEGAIAARRLNPGIRLVVRSAQANLNQLLKEQLGGFVALDPTELPAAAFATAGIASDTLGFFPIGEHSMRVVERELTPKDVQWLDLPAHNLHRRQHRLISTPDVSSDRLFFQWQPEHRLQIGDYCAYIELIDRQTVNQRTPVKKKKRRSLLASWLDNLRQFNLGSFWEWIQAKQARQAVFFGMIVGFILWLANTLVLYNHIRNLPLHRAAATAVVLLLGGYGDVFDTGGLGDPPVPAWVEMFCLTTTVISIIYVLGVLGIIADSVISSKFDFLKAGIPIPEEDHVVIVGFGRLGQKVARLLHELNQPIVILTSQTGDLHPPPQTPIISGTKPQDLEKANVQTARSVVAVTDNQMLNLEVTLLAKNAARKVNRNIDLVIRTQDQFFSENLEELLPKSKALNAYALSAEAFAGAAFGEDMLSVFRLNNQTVLVAEYEIMPGDTLVGKTLAQVAYGYDVVPIFLETLMPRVDENRSFYLPVDDELLNEGDRLIVLASISGLRRIEQGEMRLPRRWQIHAKPPLNPNASHDISNKFSHISGCDLETARKFVEQLPTTLEINLYDMQAFRLGQNLSKLLPIKMLPF